MLFTRLLSRLALVLCLSQLATAQLIGRYEVELPDGSPAIAGAVTTFEVHLDPNGNLVGQVYVDTGTGPAPIPGEDMRITALDPGSLTYGAVNGRGTNSAIYWNHSKGRFESIILDGKNIGRVTVLKRL